MAQEKHIAWSPEREALRAGFRLRIVDKTEEGSDISVLPEGVYGFTGAPATAEIPLFVQPYFECYEIHKLPGGETAWVGYVTEREYQQYEQGAGPMNLDLYPEPHGEAKKLVRIVGSRVDRRRPPTRDNGNSMKMEIGPAAGAAKPAAGSK